MHIMMLAQFYPPIVGGEERHVQDLSTELARRGHDVSVVTLQHADEPAFELDQGVRIHRIRTSVQRMEWLYSDAGRRHAPPFPDPEALLALRRLIDIEHPDIIHAHNWLVYSFVLLKRRLKIPLILTLHDYSFLCAKKRYMYQGAVCTGPSLIKCLSCASNHYGVAKGFTTVLGNRAMGQISRAAVDMFIAVSQATAVHNGLIRDNLPFQIIPDFVRDDIGEVSFSDDPRIAQLPKDGYILFVGDLSGEKGVHVLLQAYSQLQDAPPLVLIGRWGQDTPTEFPPNVLAFNKWPHEAVMEAWRRCSIALAPSVWSEPFGIVVLEAMASSRPVIASRAGGLPDMIVDGETGLLVSPGDVGGLRQALERLLADGQLRERLGAAAKQKVNEFKASTILPLMEQLYETVITESYASRLPRQQGDEEQTYWGISDT